MVKTTLIVGAALLLVNCSDLLPVRTGQPPSFFQHNAIITSDNGFEFAAHIISGKAFGVSIGDIRTAAKEKILNDPRIKHFDSFCNLSEGYVSDRPDQVVLKTDPVIANCVSNSWTDSFTSRGSVTGWINLHSQDGLIDRIEWRASKSPNPFG